MSVKLETQASRSVSEEPQQSTRITNDDLYRRSSQYRLWSFTSSQLEDICISVNKKGIAATKSRIDKLNNSDISLNPDLNIVDFIKEVSSDDAEGNGGNKFVYVTEKEERKIVVACADIANRYAKLFKLPAQVRATAITYLMRFFLMHSVMEYNPQYIMYTCLFLAAKVENHFIGIKTFSQAINKTTPESILQYEYLILETMRFTLLAHHPYQPLYGFYLDIQNVLPKIDLARLGNLYDSARATVGKSLLTNVQFLYTPPQIALACLWGASNAITERYLAKKFGLKRKKIINNNNNNNHNNASLIKGDENNSLTPIAENELEADADGDGDGDGDGDAELEETNNNAEETEAIKTATEGLTPASDSIDSTKKQIQAPQERYEKMIKLIKECHSKIIQDSQIDNDAAKPITSKIRYCLSPEKFYSKIAKQKGQSTATNTVKPKGSEDDNSNQSKSASVDTPIETPPQPESHKRPKSEGEEGGGEEEEAKKRIKIEGN